METNDISASFPFESKYIDILGSKIHYIEEGEGDPILFLHGNPTSSYLWRNIIPYMVPLGRCIGPDLIGMGKSDKPDVGYRFFDHVKYLEEFIEKLDLHNITLVIHDWGSALGFYYAMRHENNVKGFAFMEAILRPMTWADFRGMTRIGFKLMRSPIIGWFMVNVMNVFIKQVLPKSTVRTLTPEEKRIYSEPFKTIKSRKPVRKWPSEIPVNGHPTDVHKSVLAYNQWLQKSALPKLFFHASPGMAIGPKEVEWCKQNLRNLTTVALGKGIHFLQEDKPHQIGAELNRWYKDLF